jgi:hypothetical protein
VTLEHRASASSVGSVWNSGGTWEEKDVSTQGKALLKEHLLETQHTLDKYTIKITETKKLNGSVNLVFTRV